ncbi:MAG: hypothetical protein WAN11_05460 [Syntrophobacteraceae bacterium]
MLKNLLLAILSLVLFWCLGGAILWILDKYGVLGRTATGFFTVIGFLLGVLVFLKLMGFIPERPIPTFKRKLGEWWRFLRAWATSPRGIEYNPISRQELERIGFIKEVHAESSRLAENDLYDAMLTPEVVAKASLSSKWGYKSRSWIHFDGSAFFVSCGRHIKGTLVSLFYERYRHSNFRGIALISGSRSHDQRIFSDVDVAAAPLIQQATKEIITADNTANKKTLQNLIKASFDKLRSGDSIVIVMIFVSDQINSVLQEICVEFINKGLNIAGVFSFFGCVEEEFQFRDIKREILIELNLE